MTQESRDLTIAGQTDIVAPIADTALVSIAEQLEKRVEAMKKIKTMALRLTNKHDWVDEGGRPYLQSSGAEKVARLFGISWRISEPTIEHLEGGHWLVTYTGEFSLGGSSIDVTGTRSSKDPFFKQYRWDGPEGNRTKTELPPSEIDRGNVKKAAYSNLLANGITRLLGIRNLSWEELETHANIRRQDVVVVTFKKGGKPAGKPAPKAEPQAAPPDNGSGATEAQVKAIHAILGKLGIADELAKAQKVQGILELKDAPTSMGKLTKSQASDVIKALQAEVEGGE